MPLPDDRPIHKFLAIRDVALVLTGKTVSIQKDEEAEVQCIEAIAKLRAIEIPDQAVHDVLDRMGNVQQDALICKLTGKEKDDANAMFFELDPDAQKYSREMDRKTVKRSRQAPLAVYRERMRNQWFALSLSGIALGLVAPWCGF